MLVLAKALEFPTPEPVSRRTTREADFQLDELGALNFDPRLDMDGGAAVGESYLDGGLYSAHGFEQMRTAAV